MGQFRLDQTRCVNHSKYVRGGRCNRCMAACPQQAIAGERIDSEKCIGCGLCLAVCPVNAIETSTPYLPLLAQEDEKAALCLACRKTAADSAFACLAFLNERLLFALAQRHVVSLALAQCGGCAAVVGAHLRRSVALCNAALPEEKKICVLDSAAAAASAERMDRRAFLKELAKTAASFFSAVRQTDAPETFSQYREKVFLKEWLAGCAAPSRVFYSCSISGACAACLRCVQACPEKALSVTRDAAGVKLRFDSVLCGGCRICVECCPEGAIRIEREESGAAEFSIALPRCAACGQIFRSLDGASICLECQKKEGGGAV